ncbi:MAG: hypothetical protein KQJ78_03125 [Deltaproteobacteria bacterium]|nr:hypothetical protein [Deltaproteobacteria bacterium]
MLVRLRALAAERHRLLDDAARLQAENEALSQEIAGLEAWLDAGPAAGVQVGRVSGQVADGEPAVVDAEGRVPVLLFWDGQEKELLARPAMPWNIPGGGFTFLPRRGQEVALGFENGDPSLPVIIGYLPGPSTPLDYDPAATAPQGTLAATVDATGQAYNPTTSNQYKTLIRSQGVGEGGLTSEIALVDQPGNEEMSLATQGRLRQQSDGDRHFTVNGQSVQDVGGQRRQEVQGNYDKKIGGDYNRKVGGNYQSFVTGNKRQAVSGDYHLAVTGQITMSVSRGRSTHNLMDSATNQLYLIGDNSLVLGESLDVNIGIYIKAFVGNYTAMFVQQMLLTVARYAAKLVGFDNKAVAMKAAVAVVGDAAAQMVNDGPALEDVGAELKTPAMAVKAFATRINTGLKINF